jgi:hypothetical protein
VELALKAFLRLRGRADDHLTSMGHNLLAAWSAARHAGLALGADVPSWVQILNGVHDQPFGGGRPPADTGLVTPNPSELGLHLSELIESVAHAAASREGQAGPGEGVR